MKPSDRMNRHVLVMSCCTLASSVASSLDWDKASGFFLGGAVSACLQAIYYAVKARKAGEL